MRLSPWGPWPTKGGRAHELSVDQLTAHKPSTPTTRQKTYGQRRDGGEAEEDAGEEERAQPVLLGESGSWNTLWVDSSSRWHFACIFGRPVRTWTAWRFDMLRSKYTRPSTTVLLDWLVCDGLALAC